MPACCSVSITARVASGDVVGFSREVPSIDPPSRCTRDTSSIASGRSAGRIPADEVLEPIADADDLEALVERLDGRGRDDGIDARGRSAADEDAEALR